MRVLLDTNILLDILEKRQPFYPASQGVLDACDAKGVEVFLAWHSLSNAFYIFGRKAGLRKAKEALEEALQIMSVASTGHPEAMQALAFPFTDLEDAMQAAAAVAARADYIITRDFSGFAGSPVCAISPEEFALLA